MKASSREIERLEEKQIVYPPRCGSRMAAIRAQLPQADARVL